MFHAACDGDLDLVRYHVSNGVDVNYAHPEFLSTPLVASILAGQEDVALFLLRSGANPNLPSEFDAFTPIEAANQMGLPALAARLRELGATPTLAPKSNPLGWFGRFVRRSAAKP